MKHIELRDSFLIGHRQIDAEHAHMVTLLNACIDISNAKGNRADFSTKFLELGDAVGKHMINEEAIMIEFGYLNVDKEIGVHEKGIQIFDELVKDCQRNVSTEMILKQAVSNLLELMLKADLGFKDYLHKIGYSEPFADIPHPANATKVLSSAMGQKQTK